MTATIYQVNLEKDQQREDKIGKSIAFRSYREDDFDLILYDKVFEIEVSNADRDAIDILEDLYYVFNVNHPKDYRGRSLSMSDVIQLDSDYYYCDMVGWKKISI